MSRTYMVNQRLACPECGESGINCITRAWVRQDVTIAPDGELEYGIYESEDVEFEDEEYFLCCECGEEAPTLEHFTVAAS